MEARERDWEWERKHEEERKSECESQHKTEEKHLRANFIKLIMMAVVVVVVVVPAFRDEWNHRSDSLCIESISCF